MSAHFGMIGLGTMGRNFALNVADHGFGVCGYDRDEGQRSRLLQEGSGKEVTVAASSAELVQQLQTPRIIMLLVPAGKIVDAVIEELLPQLSKGDIIIDGGNSHYNDTERRYNALQNSGIHFIGMGVSGGEEGARKGPSMMPGGNKESYDLIKEILEAVSAKAPDDAPCVAFMGNTAAGHYVKMVHNGIEYAVMQMISEVYSVLKNAGFTNAELHDIFKEWNAGELASFLVEITSEIFAAKDPDTGNDLVDIILDKAKQKGTGLWTSVSALELNVPIPTIDVSVSMRYMSSLKAERVRLSQLYNHHVAMADADKETLKNICRDALHFGIMMAYAQGIELLEVASAQFNYQTSIKTVIQVWRAGCIIRSALLNDLYKAYDKQPDLKNIIASEIFMPVLKEKRGQVVQFVKIAMDGGLPVAASFASLSYFDAYTLGRMPANLIQAQRDFFGAHTYERTDKEGIFHTDWNG